MLQPIQQVQQEHQCVPEGTLSADSQKPLLLATLALSCHLCEAYVTHAPRRSRSAAAIAGAAADGVLAANVMAVVVRATNADAAAAAAASVAAAEPARDTAATLGALTSALAGAAGQLDTLLASTRADGMREAVGVAALAAFSAPEWDGATLRACLAAVPFARRGAAVAAAVASTEDGATGIGARGRTAAAAARDSSAGTATAVAAAVDSLRPVLRPPLAALHELPDRQACPPELACPARGLVAGAGARHAS
jgi:hypothetical protein